QNRQVGLDDLGFETGVGNVVDVFAHCFLAVLDWESGFGESEGLRGCIWKNRMPRAGRHGSGRLQDWMDVACRKVGVGSLDWVFRPLTERPDSELAETRPPG
ncbi:hypothetical protein, partial [Methyloversatilis discipulorum]|uniref:hypothetical protein n=1 Tax=Methyloversatilis discipulorum TaxID=1119528 RepID=UPI0031379902